MQSPNGYEHGRSQPCSPSASSEPSSPGRRRVSILLEEDGDLSKQQLAQSQRPGRVIREHLRKYGVADWADLPFDKQVAIMEKILRPSRFLIDPDCWYMERWDCVVMLALCFVGVVTPFEVAFLESSMSPLWVLNRIIDFVFIKDIVIQFFLMFREGEGSQPILVRDHIRIRNRYLRSWFGLDVLSVLPFDTAGMILQNQEFAQLKVVRTMRLLRLIKLMRILRASRIVHRWTGKMEVSYASIALFRFGSILVIAAHVVACFWGLLGGMGLDQAGYSWVAALRDGKDGSQDSAEIGPGSSWFSGAMGFYVVSLYWSVMTITGIGYGDVAPQLMYEYYTGVLFMLIGGLFWAWVVGSVCKSVANTNMFEKEHCERMDTLMVMCKDLRLNKDLRTRLRLHFNHSRRLYRQDSYIELQQGMSDSLQGELALHAVRQYLGKLKFFVVAEDNFVMKVARSMKSNYFGPKEAICVETSHFTESPSMTVQPMTMLEEGLATLKYRILGAGSIWHEDMLLDRESLIDKTCAVAVTFCSVYYLTKTKMTALLESGSYPQAANAVRRWATRLTLTRAMRKAMLQAVELRRQLDSNGKLSLLDLLQRMSGMQEVQFHKAHEASQQQVSWATLMEEVQRMGSNLSERLEHVEDQLDEIRREGITDADDTDGLSARCDDSKKP
eukprot:gnl/TRDRNA2_/TRDRNA2_80453_c0_seq1.p1 gnl/TRDRNA2_/TRDRNA2_80453_c0~~gnl/TRDRNA2_/TRDRNA2_80453_c0_seq1.p1  ORF type:complete len:670 (+),score=98.45 gnl/TRDRNA2_/TRDRNA2_80453_c0_seq1:103-2112(+)